MRGIEETMNDVAFTNGYINWEDFLKSFQIPKERQLEFNSIVGQVAKDYSRDAEAYYNESDFGYDGDDHVKCPECFRVFEIQDSLI